MFLFDRICRRLCSEICEFHSLGVSTCLTSQQNRLTSIRIFSRIMLPCACSNFAQNITIQSVMVMIKSARDLGVLVSHDFDLPSVQLARRRKAFLDKFCV